MRFNFEIVLLVSCSLLCNVAQADSNIRLVPLGEGGKYFSFVDEEGALNRNYEDAEIMCRNHGGKLWDINHGDPLRSGKNRADTAIAKSVLTALRKVPEVGEKQLKDEVTFRLNVVFGNRGGLPDGQCKWYLAGPYTDDFYAFTYYDACPQPDASAALSWFVCQAETETQTTPPDEETTTKDPVSEAEITTASSTPTTPTTTSTPSSTTDGYGDDPGIIEDIRKTIDTTNDTASLIREVTDDIEKLGKPFRGLPQFQENLVKRLEELVKDDAEKASSATRDLFSETVPTLALKMENRDDYVSVLRFVSNITSRIAVFTEAGRTNITNRDTRDAVLYRLQHFKLDGNRRYRSEVRTSTVNAEYEGESGGGTILTTHMEFKNEGIKRKMINASYRGPEKFSSDLVEFFMRFTDGTAYNASVDLFFEAETMQARRVKEHDCVFFNIGTGELDETGCEFKELTPDGKVHCHCNHTTTFGSIFLPNSLDSEYEIALNIVGHTMDCFSLSALLLSILVFSLVRQIRTVLTVIHLNLCICLFVSEVIIVAHSFAHLISPQFKCFTALGMLIHYAFLTVIAWSTLEGIYILQLMIVVFKPPESHTRYYLLIGYLLPALFPAIAVYLGGAYETESGPLCFLNKTETGLFWTFLGPLVAMLSVNVVAISAVIYRLCTINRSVKTVKSELLRYLRGVVCMSALLGLQWVLGIISVPFDMNQQGLKFACVLLFVIFTLLQGPLIFVVHIMLVKDTRYAVARYLSRRGRWSRCIANYIRPPPPATETHSHQGNSSTRTTGVASSNNSSSAPQTPLELNSVTTNPL